MYLRKHYPAEIANKSNPNTKSQALYSQLACAAMTTMARHDVVLLFTNMKNLKFQFDSFSTEII